MNKKAVSPLVATILLIAFAIALGAVVMNWGKGYIEEKAEFVAGGAAVSPASCGNVMFSVLEIGGKPQVCNDNGEVRVLLENEGTAILNFKANVVMMDGVDNQENLLSGPIEKADTASLKIPVSGDVIQVKLVPQIIVEGVSEYCTASSVTLENIVECE